MASAGSPAIAIPSMARMNRNIGHSPMADDSSVSSAAASSETLMIGLRDHPSATAPTTSIETARQAVVTDSARLLVAALTWNSRVKIGSSGCTAYIRRKTEKPAEKTARLIFQKARDPRATWVRGLAGPVVRGFTRSTAREGETDAERHQDGAGHGLDAAPDAIRQQHRRHAIDEPCVDGQPEQPHDDVRGGEEDRLREDRAIGDDELRQEGDVEDRHLRVQQVGEESLSKGLPLAVRTTKKRRARSFRLVASMDRTSSIVRTSSIGRT